MGRLESMLEAGSRKYAYRNGIAYDHLGRKYRSAEKMCEAYGIDEYLFRYRCSSGWTVEKALTTPEEKVKDHLGNEYSTVKEMCEKYGITQRSYYKNITLGHPLGTILNKCRNGSCSMSAVDHLGNEYKSVSLMCKQYGVKESKFYSRWKSGRSLENCLKANDIERIQLPKRLNTYGAEVMEYYRSIADGADKAEALKKLAGQEEKQWQQ